MKKQSNIESLDENNIIEADFVHLARLAAAGKDEDVRLLIARLVLKYRDTLPRLSRELEKFLKDGPCTNSNKIMRKSKGLIDDYYSFLSTNTDLFISTPIDHDSNLQLIKVYRDNEREIRPILSESLLATFEQIFQERQVPEKLIEVGLKPTTSAAFIGAPGVGKTIAARWVAARLGLPLYVLDLTVVMSSYLGKSGANLRTVLDFAKAQESVLLLDEIDAIAKKRDDFLDVGELKRLVTIMLQEIEEWPATSLLLAATNYPDLVDPALWRRFDMVVEFPMPGESEMRQAIMRFFGQDAGKLSGWVDVFAALFNGKSFSDIERAVHRFRRIQIFEPGLASVRFGEIMRPFIHALGKTRKIELAKTICGTGAFSQHEISTLLGISRDTIRKYCGPMGGNGKAAENGD
ncbi:MAG: ATP-binding protein [Deltaproteobacteria bacterium]|nr:ATP-binding protein [Deltaproteobacteria bacterium]